MTHFDPALGAFRPTPGVPPELIEAPSQGELASFGAGLFLATVCYPKDLNARSAFLDAFGVIAALRGSRRKLSRGAERAYNRAAKMLWSRRLPAGEAAYSLQLNAIPAMGPVPQLGGARLVIRSKHDGITDFATDREEQLMHRARSGRTSRAPHQDANNFLPQIWSTTKPVIHLSVALFRKVKDLGKVDLMELVRNPNWLPSALRMAVGDAEMLPLAIPNLRSSHMIQVVPIEPDPVINRFKPAYLREYSAFVNACVTAYENTNQEAVDQLLASAKNWWLLRSARALRSDHEDPATQGRNRAITDHFGPLFYAEIHRRISAGYPKTWAISQFLM